MAPLPMCMVERNRRLALCAPLLIALCGACEPTFEHSGELSVGNQAFVPRACHVLCGVTGVELIGANGARIELTLPPAELRAFRSINGAPTVVVEREAGQAPFTAASCGQLTLTGMGYHGAGKRAARGDLSLDCAGAQRIAGRLSFSGCF